MYFPRWCLQRFRVEPLLGPEGELKLQTRVHQNTGDSSLPTVIWFRQGGTVRVLVPCPRAEGLGIRSGMTLAEALAVAGPQNLRLEAWNPQADRRVLEALGYFCQRFTPTVALEPGDRPESLFLDIAGTTPYFGGEEALWDQVSQALSSLGVSFRLAIADSAGAAWAICRFAYPSQDGGNPEEGKSEEKTPKFPRWIIPPGQVADVLRSLPVAALRLEESTLGILHQLGIRTIGQLVAIPSEELVSRFGRQILRRWEEYLGRVPEVLAFLPSPAELRVVFAWEDPVSNLEVLLQGAEELLQKLRERLLPQNEGIIALRCTVGVESTETSTIRRVPIEILLHTPTLDCKHLAGLLALRLEQRKWEGDIRWIELQVTQRGPLPTEQGELISGTGPQRKVTSKVLGELFDRLRARLGEKSLGIPCLTGDVQPERAYELVPPSFRAGSSKENTPPRLCPEGLGESREEQGKAFSPRPLTLLACPLPIRVIAVSPWGTPAQVVVRGKRYGINRVWGPERIETGWWRGRTIRRDYYRVETREGQQFWIFRHLEEGTWFLHGTFD